MTRVALRVLARHLGICLLKTAGALQDVSKLRFQAVFLIGAGGSGKGFVGRRWMKYMPGGGATPKFDSDAVKRRYKEEERGLTNLNFEKVLNRIKGKGIEIELVDTSHAKIPFRLFWYDTKNNNRIVPLDPKDWKERLPPEIYKQVEGLKEVIFSTPVHELPSYWRQVNPDIYKEELAGYMEKEPGYVHEMSSDLSKAYFEAAIETGDPIFVDGTGSNEAKVLAQMKQAKDRGYRISLVYVLVPMTVNQIRNALRSRNVDPYIIAEQWRSIGTTYAKTKAFADVSKVVINRDDVEDIAAYKENADKVNDFIRSKTDYPNLYEFIKAENPKELAEWGQYILPDKEEYAKAEAVRNKALERSKLIEEKRKQLQAR